MIPQQSNNRLRNSGVGERGRNRTYNLLIKREVVSLNHQWLTDRIGRHVICRFHCGFNYEPSEIPLLYLGGPFDLFNLGNRVKTNQLVCRSFHSIHVIYLQSIYVKKIMQLYLPLIQQLTSHLQHLPCKLYIVHRTCGFRGLFRPRSRHWLGF